MNYCLSGTPPGNFVDPDPGGEVKKRRKRDWRKGSLLFKVSRLIAESDSIGENYQYNDDYNFEQHAEKPNEYKDIAKQIIKIVKKHSGGKR